MTLFTVEQKGLAVIVETVGQSLCIPDDICEQFKMNKGDVVKRWNLEFRNAREAEFGCGVLTWILQRFDHEIAVAVRDAVVALKEQANE